MQNKKNIENKKNFDAEGKFDARWDDKLKFFFKGPYNIQPVLTTSFSTLQLGLYIHTDILSRYHLRVGGITIRT